MCSTGVYKLCCHTLINLSSLLTAYVLRAVKNLGFLEEVFRVLGFLDFNVRRPDTQL